MMEEKGTTKLWVQVAEKSLFGKNRVKDVYFILKVEQIPEVKEILDTWVNDVDKSKKYKDIM